MSWLPHGTEYRAQHKYVVDSSLKASQPWSEVSLLLNTPLPNLFNILRLEL